MRLSEFKDEKAIEMVAALLEPIGNIASNPENQKAAKSDWPIPRIAGAFLRNNPRDVMDMLAVLDDKDPAEYHCTAASVLVGAINMMNDPDLIALFGLQRQTPASSGSASESTEGQVE